MGHFFDVFFPYQNETETESSNKTLTEMDLHELGVYFHHKAEDAFEFFPHLCSAIITGLLGLWIINCAVRRMHAQLRKTSLPMVPRGLPGDDVPANLKMQADSDSDSSDGGAQMLAVDQQPIEPTVLDFGVDVLKLTCYVLLAMMTLSMVGIQTDSFIAAITAASLAFSLALQPMLLDVVRGLTIIVFQPFKKGDLVTVAGMTGFIQATTLFNIFMRTDEGLVNIIPSQLITDVSNLSSQGTYRLDVPFKISNDEDFLRAKKLMLDTAKSFEMCLPSPEPQFLCGGMDDTGTTVIIRAYVLAEHVLDWQVIIEEGIWLMFVREKVKIPRNILKDTPQMR